MADENKTILTVEAFKNFDETFRNSVFDRKHPWGYYGDSTGSYVTPNDAYVYSSSCFAEVSKPRINYVDPTTEDDQTKHSFTLATNWDIEQLFN